MVSNESLKAQGSLTGKIFDEKGEPVYNAKVFNKNDKLKVVRSDFEGNYSIEITSNQPQNILIAFNISLYIFSLSKFNFIIHIEILI